MGFLKKLFGDEEEKKKPSKKKSPPTKTTKKKEVKKTVTKKKETTSKSNDFLEQMNLIIDSAKQMVSSAPKHEIVQSKAISIVNNFFYANIISNYKNNLNLKENWKELNISMEDVKEIEKKFKDIFKNAEDSLKDGSQEGKFDSKLYGEFKKNLNKINKNAYKLLLELEKAIDVDSCEHNIAKFKKEISTLGKELVIKSGNKKNSIDFGKEKKSSKDKKSNDSNQKLTDKYDLKNFDKFWFKDMPKEFNTRFYDEIKKELKKTKKGYKIVISRKDNQEYVMFEKEFLMKLKGFEDFFDECTDICVKYGSGVYPTMKRGNQKEYAEVMAINRYNWAFDNGEKLSDEEEGKTIIDFFKPLEKKGISVYDSNCSNLKYPAVIIGDSEDSLSVSISFEENEDKNFNISIHCKGKKDFAEIIHEINKCILSLSKVVDVTYYQYYVLISDVEVIEDGEIKVDEGYLEEFGNDEDSSFNYDVLFDEENWVKYSKEELEKIIKLREQRMIEEQDNVYVLSGTLNIQGK
jgi:hypothetical protein